MNAAAQWQSMQVRDDDLLGELATWEMGSKEVSLPDVRSALRMAGFDDEAIKDLSHVVCFNRAIQQYKKDRVIDRVEREGDVVTFQFSKKHLDEYSSRMEYPFEAKITLNVQTGDIVCNDSWEIQQHAVQMFEHAKNHRVTSDVTKMVQNLFETQADMFRVNKSGGVYFVPVMHRDFCARIATLMQELGGKLKRYPIAKGTEEGDQSVSEDIQAGLGGLIDELEGTVRDWSESTRTDTMMKAAERFQIIEHKIKAFCTYFEDRGKFLQDNLKAAKQAMVAKVSEIEASKQVAA